MKHFKIVLLLLTFATAALCTACEEDAELTEPSAPLKNDIGNSPDASDVRGDRPRTCFHC